MLYRCFTGCYPVTLVKQFGMSGKPWTLPRKVLVISLKCQFLKIVQISRPFMIWSGLIPLPPVTFRVQFHKYTLFSGVSVPLQLLLPLPQLPFCALTSYPAPFHLWKLFRRYFPWKNFSFFSWYYSF